MIREYDPAAALLHMIGIERPPIRYVSYYHKKTNTSCNAAVLLKCIYLSVVLRLADKNVEIIEVYKCFLSRCSSKAQTHHMILGDGHRQFGVIYTGDLIQCVTAPDNNSKSIMFYLDFLLPFFYTRASPST